jgi:predicted DNA-binding transcriptional regulator AlpA
MQLLNFGQTRRKLGNRGRSTVYRDVEKGRLPKPVKLGGRLYWFEDQLDEAVAKPRSEAAVETAILAATDKFEK